MVESKPKFFAYTNSNEHLKVRVAAALANADLEYCTVKGKVTELSNSQYPYLETSSGKVETTPLVMQYVGNLGAVAGTNDDEKAEVLKWMQFSANEIDIHRQHTLNLLFGLTEYDEKAHHDAEHGVKNNLKSLEEHLKGKEYVLGKAISVADVDLWVSLKHFWQLLFPEPMRKKVFANTDAWFNRVSENSAVKSVFGVTQTCKFAMKIQKPEKKKEEKKPEQKKDDEVKEEPKKKQVFPESKLNFDEFKKSFFNNNEREKTLDEMLFNEFENTAFSIYYLRYQKLDSEGKELWKTENMRDIFIQKSEDGRKHSFGNLNVVGVEGDYDITGVWLWRGVGVPEFMQENESFEYWDQIPLDPSNPDHLKRIKEHWLAKLGETTDGKTVVNDYFFR